VLLTVHAQVEELEPVSAFAGICYLVHLAQQSLQEATTASTPGRTSLNSLGGPEEAGLHSPKDLVAGTRAAGLAAGLGGGPVRLRWVIDCAPLTPFSSFLALAGCPVGCCSRPGWDMLVSAVVS
jgi:hypothetical protein